MSRYIVELTITGYLEVEATSQSEAREMVEDGFLLKDLNWMNDEIDDVYLSPTEEAVK